MDQNKDTRDTRKRTKNTITPQQLIELGKLPPQAVDLESAVLGALMLDKDALSNVVDILKPEAFYKEAHQRIFAAIQSLFAKAEPVDILTVTQELKRTGELEIAGGAFYVTQLTNRIASAANVQLHARIVLEKHLQRELIRISTDTLQHAYEDTSDVFELLNKAEQNLFSISQTNIRKDFEHIRPLLGKTIQEIEAARNHELMGVQSGFTGLDRITGGWQRADLIILAARPGTGKTAFVVTVARNAAVEFKKPVAIFSLEMTANQLVSRFISGETELPADKLRKGELREHEYQQLNSKISRLVDAPIYIDDTPALSIFEFRAKARRLKAQHNVSMVIVDYLQLMVSGQEGKFNREQEVSMISRSLKAIAKELDVPIIALSQLSRAVEQRGGSKRPQLSDLRESGAIEQDADIVMFIYRPDMAGITQDENGMSTDGMAEIIIAKHRNGRIDSANLMFIPHLAKFVEPSTSITPLSEQRADEFNADNTIIRGSKMNDIEEDL
ncbi:MAG: replicative DNA helicase [Bacteroidetes bacterium]|nr:MAG: replicative DNA helicase [Bacteroidota bacterium]